MISNIAIIILLLFAGCSSQQEEKTKVPNDTIQRQVISFNKWVFKIDNENPDNIGYKVYTDDESIGVKGIYPADDYVYITDVYHTNIKRINIKTGELVSSKCLASKPADESGIWLRDIAMLDNNIYVTSDRDSIYVFNLELKYLYAISTEKGRKHFEKVTQDFLLVNNLLRINKNGNVTKVKEAADNVLRETVQGKEFKKYEKEGKYYFQSQYGAIELKYPIPKIQAYSGAENFNFNSSTLVYFNSTPTEFILYVYEY